MSVLRHAIAEHLWEPDVAVSQCRGCAKPFGTFNRRHHCRQCGKVICTKCSDHQVAMTEPSGQIKQGLRCCDICFSAAFRHSTASEPVAAPRTETRLGPSTQQTQHAAEPPSAPAKVQPAADVIREREALDTERNRAAQEILASEAECFRALRDSEVSARQVLRDIHERSVAITGPFLSTLRSVQWSAHSTVDGVAVFAGTVSNVSKKACKCVFSVKADIGVAIATITDITVMQQFEPSLQSADVLPHAAEGTIEVVTKYRSTGLISGRDFATISAERTAPTSELVELFQLSEGETLYAGFVHGSVDNPTVQCNAGYVRGVVHSFGYALGGVRAQSGALSTLVVHLSHIDPKGSIPNFALESTFGDNARRVAKLRRYIEERATSTRASSLTRMMEGTQSPDADVDTPVAKSPAAAAVDVAPSPRPAPAEVLPEAPQQRERSPTPEPTPVLEAISPLKLKAITDGKRRVLQPTLSLNSTQSWRMSKTLEDCDLEDTSVPFSDKKALRISTTIKATLATFASFLADASQLSKYDPTLDKFEVIRNADEHAETMVTYSSYKQATRLIAPRDFCAEGCGVMLSTDEVIAERVANRGVAFVQGAINSQARPAVKGWTRGVLHVFGYIATAESFDAPFIRVSNVMCVDPSGSIPNWLIDAAQAESCKKLAKIRSLVEERQVRNPAAVAQSSTVESQDLDDTPSRSTTARPDLNESGDFQSCVDAEEFEKERQDIKQFHEDEVSAICANLTAVHTSSKWDSPQMIEGCKVQMADIEGCPVKAVRISAEFACGIETFKSVISNTRTIFEIDPTADKVELLPSPPFGTVIYTAYKSSSRLLTSRDFCTLSTTALLSEEEGARLGLYTQGITSSAFVVSTVNSADMPEQAGFIRGSVRAFGYIAVATPPSAKRIRVFHLAAVDPKGQLPARVVDLAVSDTCKKVLRLQELCVNVERAKTLAFDGSASPASSDPTRDNVASCPSQACPAIEKKIIGLQISRGWQSAQQVGNCKVETMDLPDLGITANRTSMDFKCSLVTLESMINSSSVAAQIDPTLEVIRVMPSRETPAATVVYTAYKSSSRLLTSRDFCTVTTSRMLGSVEGAELGLFTQGISSAVFLNCSNNSDEVPLDPKFVRGTIHAFGYVGIATPPNAKRIRVFQIAAVNPGGNIPAKWVAHAVAENCNKMSRLAVLCEEKEREAEETRREVPSALDGPTEIDTPQQAAVDSEVAQSDTHDRTDANSNHGEAAPASPSSALTLSQRSVLRPLLDLHLRCSTWKKVKVLQECVLEVTGVSFSDKQAQRITTTMNCTLRQFAAFLSDTQMMRRYDPTLAKFDVLSTSENTLTTYSAYSQATRLISARDFCSQSTRTLLGKDEAAATGLGAVEGAVFVSNAVDSNAAPPHKGFVRGRIHVYGFFATAETEDSKPITVSNLLCVDPGGSIPNWVLEVATVENVKKVAKIRELVSQQHA